MKKRISYNLIVGSFFISTKLKEATEEQIDKYMEIIDKLLPENYYTYKNAYSFEDFCQRYNFLIKKINDKIILACDLKRLKRYFKVGVPNELIKVFNLAGAEFNERGKVC